MRVGGVDFAILYQTARGTATGRPYTAVFYPRYAWTYRQNWR